jgi:peptidyl-prolyl cis-trans isomerase D
MFGTIRKHQTWLWAVIITVTIISFVVFFSPASKVNSSYRRGEGNFGSISGEKINADDFYAAKKEVMLQYFFMSGGNWLSSEDEAKRSGFDVEQRTYARLFLIRKQQDLGIHIASDVAAQYATEMVKPLAQKLQAPSPQKLIEEVVQRGGLDLSDFDRFTRHELGIQELITTVGMAGKLVTPEEAREFYVRENQEMQTEVVFFNASNYTSQVTVNPRVLGQFFTNQMAAYRIPDRVQVAYVAFPASNYLAQAEKEVTNLNEIVETTLTRLGTNSFKDATTPEQKRVKVREELLHRASMNLAMKAARQFDGPILDATAVRPEALPAAAQTNGLTVKMSTPFDREDPPKELDVDQTFLRAAFSLTPEDPVSAPIAGESAVYVLGYQKVFPSEIPSLDAVRGRVTADYKFMQAVMLAQKAGSDFSKAATNGLAQGKSFDAIAADAKVKAAALPPFSLSTRELPVPDARANMETLKELAFGTAPGKASEFRPNREGGVVMYVKARLPIDEAKMKAEMPNFVAYVRQSRQRETFDIWFRREAEKALRDTPMFTPAPPVMKPTAKS